MRREFRGTETLSVHMQLHTVSPLMTYSREQVRLRLQITLLSFEEPRPYTLAHAHGSPRTRDTVIISEVEARARDPGGGRGLGWLDEW
ncbi:hypothetical protein HAX54_044746, partial [Datura stramonium]|nr:hypothetical protein [Datura stramonium]